jgi:hypothetical protein
VHHKILPIMELEKMQNLIAKYKRIVELIFWQILKSYKKNVKTAKRMMKKLNENLNLIVNGQTNRFSWQIKKKKI